LSGREKSKRRKTMKKITPRTRVRLYWTTDPNYMGYGLCETWNPKNSVPDLTGTPRTIVKKWYNEKIENGLNSGVYYAMRVYIGDEQVAMEDIKDAVATWEHQNTCD
jgi:hypothetical protein